MMRSVPSLGIIGCLALCDEMAHILERGHRINNVIILDTPEGRHLLDILSSQPIGHRTWVMGEDEMGSVPFSGYTVIVKVRPAGLHDDAIAMLNSTSEDIRRLEPFCDSIMLFYGLCRSTRQDIQRLMDRWEVPLTFLTEEDGSVADDCFGAVLGGRKRYLEMIRNNKDTMFITIGYAEHWASKQANKGIEKIVPQIENYQLLFRTLGYSKVMMLDNGLGDRDEFRRKVRVFASIFGFSIEYARCDMVLFERSYDLARSKIPRSALGAVELPELAFSRTLP